MTLASMVATDELPSPNPSVSKLGFETKSPDCELGPEQRHQAAKHPAAQGLPTRPPTGFGQQRGTHCLQLSVSQQGRPLTSCKDSLRPHWLAFLRTA
ncbi:hypothetical protein P7K49_005885 [Saguinus oedipus]|uniref:Uncharacterized protein n=1 Tax=Saguinus oedipus TaxID=9490 RepID=A0ABQ9W0U3_SAGOE|nr:hypothetical protein P7K49_005885 [Saguinus oedipus]